MVPNKKDKDGKEKSTEKTIVDADLDVDEEEEPQDTSSQEYKKIEELEAIIKKKDKEIAKLEDDLKWNQSDFENYRKNTEKRMDTERIHIRAKELKDFLSFFDSFDQAIQLGSLMLEKNDLPEEIRTYLKGLKGLSKNLEGILESKKLKRIEALGKKFDYDFHEVAMSVEDKNLEEDTIVKEIQKGWLLDGKVLRPTMVAVSKHPPKKETEQPAETEDSCEESPEEDQ
ncbi:MAG: nucleotide exchange factor GrpE [Candidatus Hodarchaeota archaeon]